METKPGFRADGHPVVKMLCTVCGVLHATHAACPIDPTTIVGRTIAEAADAGDSFEVRFGRDRALWMPGCVGIDDTLAAARVHWKHRIGQIVRLSRVLPGSRIGCMIVEDVGEAML